MKMEKMKVSVYAFKISYKTKCHSIKYVKDTIIKWQVKKQQRIASSAC